MIPQATTQQRRTDRSRGTAAPRRTARVAREEKRAAEEHAHFLEAQVESGRHMREFIAEHYGEIE